MTQAAENDKGIPPALAAGAALVVAVFASVGVSGGLLTRAVRNHPFLMALIVVGALGIACRVSTIAIKKQTPDRGLIWAVWGLTAVLVCAVALGAYSLTEREYPRVSLSSTSDDKFVTVTISATGSGLRSKEGMLLQVHGLTTFPADKEVEECTMNRFDEPLPPKSPPWDGKLLLWERGGSDADGKVILESKVQVPANSYEGLCAWAVLRDRDPRAFLCDRVSWDFLCDRQRDRAAYIRMPRTS